jgi:hypothetical protein
LKAEEKRADARGRMAEWSTGSGEVSGESVASPGGGWGGAVVVMNKVLSDVVCNCYIVGRIVCPCRVSPTVGFVPSWVS